jgi:hypothetical protein
MNYKMIFAVLRQVGSKLWICVHTHTGSTSSIPLPSYSKNKSVVKLVEFLFTCNLLDRLREPPARAYSPELEDVGKDKPDGDRREIGCLGIDRVEV